MRILLALCLCALLCGCGKKERPSPADADADAPTGGAAGGLVPGVSLPVAPIRPALPTGWVEFHHPEGAYAVFLPSKPLTTNSSQSLRQAVPVGHLLQSEHVGGDRELSFGLGVYVHSPELVDGYRTAEEQQKLGPNKKRTQVTWAGHSAYEIVTETSGRHGLSVERFLWIGNREYHCGIKGIVAGRPTAAERAAVFDSFVVGK